MGLNDGRLSDFLDSTRQDTELFYGEQALFLKKRKNDAKGNSKIIRATTSTTGPGGMTSSSRVSKGGAASFWFSWTSCRLSGFGGKIMEPREIILMPYDLMGFSLLGFELA